jgi:hypothetical protein
VQNLYIITGRVGSENLKLEGWAGENDVLLTVKDVMGSVTLIFNPQSPDDLQVAAQLTLRYSDSVVENNLIGVKGDQNRFSDFQILRDTTIEEKIATYRI